MKTTVRQLSTESLVNTVIGLVSQVESCGPLELPPLNESIDMDALQIVCESTSSSGADELSISFTYSDSIVRVENGDPLTVVATSASAESASSVPSSEVETDD